MAKLSDEIEKQYLHAYLERLIARFDRNQFFTINELYNCGGLERTPVGSNSHLPEASAIKHFKELSEKGWAITRIGINKRFEFKITDTYEGLPEKVTPQDIYREKMQILENHLEQKSPSAYAKICRAEKILLNLNSDADYSELGNLCIQCLEDLGQSVWDKHSALLLPLAEKGTRPNKSQIKDLLGPIAIKFIGSGSMIKFEQSLWSLLDHTRDLLEKLKHRKKDSLNTLHTAKLVVLITVIIAEELIFYVEDYEKSNDGSKQLK